MIFDELSSAAFPSMRGSTPLDVAAASVMDNNELALALEEPDLDKVSGHSDLFTYLVNTVLVLEEKRVS